MECNCSGQRSNLSSAFSPNILRAAIMPLFLFSGTFFPITNLPSWLQPVAFVSPLWHGVELTRGVAGLPDSPRWPWQIHTGILVALTAVGLVLAVRKFSKRLRV